MSSHPKNKPSSSSSKTYSYISARSGRKNGEIRYRGKRLTNKTQKKYVDKFVHSVMSKMTSPEEKCRIKNNVCNMVLNREHKKLKSSVPKYCMLFENHSELVDDWTRMWSVSNYIKI
jgi:hypothetical protein